MLRWGLVALALFGLACATQARPSSTAPVASAPGLTPASLGPVTQAPRLGNGLVYAFVGNDVLALDATTGELRWQYVAPDLGEVGAAQGCPCAATTGDFTGQDVYVVAEGREGGVLIAVLQPEGS